VLDMLETYSKGKCMKIKTNKMVKKKKAKKMAKVVGGILSSDDEEEGGNKEENPLMAEEAEIIGKINQSGKVEGEENKEGSDNEEDDEQMDYSGSEEEADSYEQKERNFNYVSEISILVDYNVISRYMSVLRLREYSKHKFLLPAIVNFMKRVVYMIKAPWIFY
jgi:hypothetical protein